MGESFEACGDIRILWVDNPPVNAINQQVRQRLLEGVRRAEADPACRGIVIACRGRTFMSGADITEFGRGPLPPGLLDVIAALDASARPVVAAIHGTALGGGLEVALACHHRVAAESAQVGLPEVKLGILPGAGGTQRLPRLIGLPRALDLIVSGDRVPAARARELGVIDRVVDGDLGDLIEGALAFLRERIAAGGPHVRVSERAVDRGGVGDDFFQAARARLARERRQLVAPQRIVDALEAAATLPFAQGMDRERALFADCLRGGQARALQHVFFAERKAAKVPDVPADAPAREIRRAAIVGAGTMGGGIAMSFANAGLPVTVLEASRDALDRGLAIVRRHYEASASKGKLTREQVESRMGLIRPTLVYDDLADADLVIEAVFETMDVKKQVFAHLDRVARPGAVLASNTSYLSIDDIARVTSRPQDVVGMHFFSPANVMRLLEIVRGAATSPEALLTALAVARRIGKVGVVAGNADGFIGNRMLAAYGQQAQLLALEGAAPDQIDRALYDFGMPMGIFQVSDLAGLDVGYKSRRDRDPSTYDRRAALVPDRLVEAGRLGQKSGAGYYDYAPGERTPRPSPVTATLYQEAAAELGVARRSIASEEIVERCFLAMVNVGVELLRERIACRSSDIDVVYIHGYGFPAHRGGPMFWAEHEIGLPAALDKIRACSAATGERWVSPSPLLEQLVAQGEGFASLDRG